MFLHWVRIQITTELFQMIQAWTLVLMLPLNADMELVFVIYPCTVGKVVWQPTRFWEIISPVQVWNWFSFTIIVMSCRVYGQSKISVYLSVFTLKIYLRRVQQSECSRSLAKICVADIGKGIGQVLTLLNRPLTIHTKYELGKFNCA